MPKGSNSTGVGKSRAQEAARRKRVVWLGVLANGTVLALAPLSLRRGFTVQMTIITTLVVLLVVNGAVWWGFRREEARLRANRPRKPLFFFALAGLSAVNGIIEYTSNDYGAAGLLLLGCVAMIGLGVITMRNNAKQDNA